MNMMKPDFIRLPSRQRGAALLTGLIFMVILTLLGITAARMAGLEERMSGNMRDRSLAMQAAEMALRDAERDILGLGTAPRNPSISAANLTIFFPSCDNDGAPNTNDDGLCDRRGAARGYTNTTITFPAFSVAGNNFPALPLDMTTAPSVAYGRFTGASAITGVAAQPRYLIEGFLKDTSGHGESFYYRITVRAQGANPNTIVWLQEVFKP